MKSKRERLILAIQAAIKVRPRFSGMSDSDLNMFARFLSIGFVVRPVWLGVATVYFLLPFYICVAVAAAVCRAWRFET